MSFPHETYLEAVRAAHLDAQLDVEADILDFKEDTKNRGMVCLKLRFRSRVDTTDFTDGGTAVQRDDILGKTFIADLVTFDESSGEVVVEVSRKSPSNRPNPERLLILTPPDYLRALNTFAECISAKPEENPEERFMQLVKTLEHRSPKKHCISQTSFLRSCQIEAVNAALQNNFMFIWGPPGTGKSYTLGHLAAEWRNTGKKVLVLAHTNAAVDVMTFAIDDACMVRNEKLRNTELIRYTKHLTDFAEYQRRPHLLAFTHLLEKLLQEEDRLRKRRADFQRKLAELSNDDKRRKEISLTIAKMEQNIAELGTIRKTEVKNLLEKASIVCVSITSCLFGSLLDNFHFDAVMIDEASLVPLAVWPWLLHPWRGTQSAQFAVAGDPLQLQPIFKRRNIPFDLNSTIQKWFESNIYAHLGIVSIASTLILRQSGTLVFLREQFRMARGIREAVSRTFYDSCLLGDGSNIIPDWPLESGIPNGSIIAIDPEECATLPTANRVRNVTGRNTNAKAIDVTLTIIRRILDNMKPRTGEKISVLVLTPFRKQSNEYKKRLTALAKPQNVLLRASTVHKSQGSEADVVIFDLVDAASWFVNDKSSALSMWCVACSRAKSQLFLLGSEPAMRRGTFSKCIVDNLSFTRLT